MIRTDDRTVSMSLAEAGTVADQLADHGHTSIPAALDDAITLINNGSATAAQVVLWVEKP